MTTRNAFSRLLTLGALLAVASPLALQAQYLTPTLMPNSVIGASYTQALSPVDTPCNNFAWSVSAGTLPPGLALSAPAGPSVNLAGTLQMPTTDQYTFTIQATPVACVGSTITANYSMRVLAIPDSNFPITAGITGTAYSKQMTALGGSLAVSSTWYATGAPPGLTLTSAGLLTGTPTTAGTYTVTFNVMAESATRQTSRTATMTIVTPPTITTTTLPQGVVGSTYSAAITGTGGLAPYTYSAVSAAPAPGVTFNNSTGTFSGTPTVAGSYVYSVGLTDALGLIANRSLTLVVNASLTFGPASLPNALIGMSYPATTFTATGGVGPYTFTRTAGTLPPGLVLSPSGVLGGTTTVAGTYPFTLRVTDAGAQTFDRNFSVVVYPELQFVTASPLPAALMATPYSTTISTVGGLPPLQVILETIPPAGLSYNSTTGILSGVPATQGTYSLLFVATDYAGSEVQRTYTLSITDGSRIVTDTLPDGSPGVPYSAALTASGFAGAPTWLAQNLPPGLTLNPSTGVISGTPSSEGTFAVSITATTVTTPAAGGQTAGPKVLTIVIGQPNLDFTPGTLPEASVNVPYRAAFTATGGDGKYSFVTLNGTLPAGLSMNADGVVSGTPTEAGLFRLTVRVTSGKLTTDKPVSIHVRAAPLTFTPEALPDAFAGESYRQTFTPVGGMGPFQFGFAAGSQVPPGLSLTQDGVLAGVPSTAGTYTFNVRVTDSAKNTFTRAYTLPVQTGLTITNTALPQATEGESYSAQIQVQGGKGPFTFEVTAGALPPGVTLSGSGELSGLPAQPGEFSFSITVTDAAQRKAVKAFRVTSFAALRLTPDSLPPALPQRDYAAQLTASGGVPPYRWRIFNGALPAGIVFENGAFRGAATATGSFAFDVQISDTRERTVSQRYTIVVGEGVTITLDGNPPDGKVGTAYSFQFTAKGGRAPFRWSVTDGLPPGLALNSSTGALAGTPTTPGTFKATLRLSDADNFSATAPFQILIGLNPVPLTSFTGVSSTAGPNAQVNFGVTLASAFAAPLDGVITLAFRPDRGFDDPAVVFANGSRRLTFTIPAGVTSANFPIPRSAFQSGTVAGLITLTAAMTVNGADVTPSPTPTATVRIDPSAPVITRIDVTRTAAGFELAVFGFTTSRQITQAQVRLTPAAGFTLSSNDVNFDLTAVFNTYFGDNSSAPFGGQFRLVLPFNVGDPAAIAAASVTLVSPQGSSSPANVTF